jgi:DCN1-like protein 1/2
MSAKIPKGKAPPPASPPQAPPPDGSKATTKKGVTGATSPSQATLPADRQGAAGRARSDIEQAFDKLRQLDKLDEGTDAIGPKGIQQLCVEMGIPHGELDMYVMVWKLGATQSGCVTRSEWNHSTYIHKIEHLGMLKSSIPQWRNAVKDDESMFTEMYFHLYDFIRGDDEKLLASEKALKAWQVLLPENERFPLLSQWALWVATEYKRSITRDVWRQLWEFGKRYKGNLASYDPNEKWPTALDDFVEWAQIKQAEREQAAQEARLKQEAAKAA